MGTSCIIIIDTCFGYFQVYRAFDGHPEGVLSDLKVVKEYNNRLYNRLRTCPQNFISNMIFYAKLQMYKDDTLDPTLKMWEVDYGICDKDERDYCVDYKYTLTDREEIAIEAQPSSKNRSILFNGKLEKAFEVFKVDKRGCHITPKLFE